MEESSNLFLALVRPHWRPLHRLAHRYADDADAARDLVQETMLRAWRAFSTTEPERYRGGWLFVILRNIAAEWHRTAKRRIRLVPMEVAELTDNTPLDRHEPPAVFPVMDEQRFREFLDDRIVDALDRLDGPFREVILLSVAGELTYREIAEVLDCPVGTVMSRMARARRSLRDRLAGFARVEGWEVRTKP